MYDYGSRGNSVALILPFGGRLCAVTPARPPHAGQSPRASPRLPAPPTPPNRTPQPHPPDLIHSTPPTSNNPIRRRR